MILTRPRILHLLSTLALLTIPTAVLAQPPEIKPVDRVHFGDIVDVDVLGGFEFDWRGGLTPDGRLNGLDAYDASVMAICRTEREIALDIAAALSRILREPRVVVRIIDRSGRAFARLDGAVRTPARFSLMRSVKLRELLVAAGGLAEGASGDITVLRQPRLACDTEIPRPAEDNGLRRLNIKFGEILSGKPGSDPEILSGDIITVERALPIYVVGNVNGPGPLYSRADLTLSQAVAAAGGLAASAPGQKATVFRRDGSDVRRIEADLGKIGRGEAEDIALQAFDIIDVAARGGSPRKYPPVITSAESREKARIEPRLHIID